MTTEERRQVRGALIAAGFERITGRAMPNDNPMFYNNRGAYREIWEADRDNTLITVDWDYKTDAK